MPEDLEGQVSGAIARADLDQVGLANTADVRLRDLAQQGRRRAMVLVSRDSSFGALAGPVMLHDAIDVVVNADQHPLGVITRSEIAHEKIGLTDLRLPLRGMSARQRFTACDPSGVA